MKEEMWKDIKGYEGLYQISSFGRVKSLSKYAGKSKREEKFLKITSDRHGYGYVALLKNGVRKNKWVHRLVAEAFVPNEYNKPLVLHIKAIVDGGDNSYTNLYWGNNSDNMKDRTRDVRMRLANERNN